MEKKICAFDIFELHVNQNKQESYTKTKSI